MPLDRHPDRYRIVFFDVFVGLLKNQRKASLLLLGLDTGCLKNMMTHSVENTHYVSFKILMPRQTAEEARRDAESLRKLAMWYTSPADKAWRNVMGEATFIALAATAGTPAGEEALALAGSVGEAGWVHQLLTKRRQSDEDAREWLARIFADFFSHGTC
jgi:hypothetical protein